MRAQETYSGIERRFTVSHEQALKASQQVLTQMGLKVRDTYRIDDSASAIIAYQEMNAVSCGVLVRVVVQSLSESETAVRIITRRKIATNIFAENDFSQPFFWNLQGKLR